MPCLTTITKNIRHNCDAPLAKGLDETIYLGMKDAMGMVATFDTTNRKIMTTLALGTGMKLFAYEGHNYSNDAEIGFERGDFETTFPHILKFAVFSNTAGIKLEIEAMATRKDLVAIIKRVSGDYEVYGYQTGLRMTVFSSKPNDDPTKGAYIITLSAPAETGLPHTFIHTTSSVIDTASYLATLIATDV